jgi:hypothetical protein
MLWALCAWRLRYRPERPDLDIVVLGDTPEDGFSQGYVRVEPADARRGLSDARAQSRTRVRHMARAWRKLCGRSPVLSAEGGRADRVRKDLVELGTHQAAFFPRVDGSALTLSRIDELLFSCLDEKDWLTPVDVLTQPSPAGEELMNHWMIRIGDFFFATRLRQWAEHRGAEAALESVPYRPERPMLEARYRLTAAGDAIKRHGLTEIAQGPPMPMWGATAYNPADPWVVVDDNAGQPRLHRPGERIPLGVRSA